MIGSVDMKFIEVEKWEVRFVAVETFQTEIVDELELLDDRLIVDNVVMPIAKSMELLTP